MEYGGIFRRAISGIIDGLIIQACFSAISFFVDAWYFVHQSFYTNLEVVSHYSTIFWGVALWKIVGYWLIAALFEVIFSGSSLQATPGKLLLGMKVIDLHGRRISYWRSLGRFLGKFLSAILWIGIILIAFTKRRQGLHDKIAGTLVVLREGSKVSEFPQDKSSTDVNDS
jgi:uncharacterized RDD family membrane protein YckC